MNPAPCRQPFMDPMAAQLLAACSVPRKALFLDRDGVINVNHGYVHTAQATEWVPGIFELVARAYACGYLPIVVTNQAGIGRGYYDEATFLHYTAWVHGEFERSGAPLVATYWCPHHPVSGIGDYRMDCCCRKPRPGMLEAAIQQFNFIARDSVMLGDSDSDHAAATATGVRFIRAQASVGELRFE